MLFTVANALERKSDLDLVSDSAALDIELLLSHVLEKDRSWLKTWPDFQLNEEQKQCFHDLFDRRVKGEPVAFILGFKGFWTLDLAVNSHILIPRPETELLIDIALNLDLPEDSKVVDLGTGSGAIALALASERSSWKILATDSECEALKLAEFNRDALHLPNVEVCYSDWYTLFADCELLPSYELIVSNPPYIEKNDPHLQQGDVRFEPRSALIAGTDGLDALRVIIEQAPLYLSTDGWLVVEHGYNQGKLVQKLFDLAGFKQITTYIDLNKQDRVTSGCWAGLA
jgi:release factor glutamine methyltransferase